MSLSGGTRLGAYEITIPLGAGGMGEVYRATDTKLGRDVAIKVLPAEVARDEERLARFEREAKLLASLNHPNIAHVYGFESASLPDGSAAHFLAMELVPGEDLAERLKRGPIPVDEALAFARQIAEALEQAHEKGIVHRDLKPANVKVTPEGKVKVLDFGLAKAFAGEAASGSSADLSQSPTLAHTGTQAGVILGTAAYMSPEQARGRAVDKRADVWAFAVLLFEMLTARRPFGGETVSEILAAVIKDEPSWEFLPTGLPAAVAGVLRRCLVKDSARRLHDIADARLLLEDAEREPEAPAPARAPRRREALAWLLAVAGIGTAAALAWKRSASPPAEPLTHFTVTLPSDRPMAFTDMPTLALSPDGRKLAFTLSDSTGQTLIHLRAFDQPEARPLPGTEAGSSPFFSPDGTSLGFFAGGRLKTVSLAGGPAQPVASASNGRGGLWAPDGSILFSPEYDTGLWRVPAAGGVAQPVVSPETAKGERSYRWPDLLPGGRAVLFTVGSLDSPNDYDKARIVAYSFATAERRAVVDGANMARFVPPDTLVYSRAGVLYAVAFDPGRLEVKGQAAPVLEGVAGDPGSGATYFAVATDGTLAVARGAGSKANRLLTLVDRKGVATRLPLTARGFRHPRFSPDGTRLAFTVGSASGLGMDADVWVYSLSSGSLSRLTFGGNVYPAWTPGGDRISYVRGRDQALVTKPADGTGAEEQLEAPVPDTLLPGSWSADGRTLAVSRVGSAREIYLLTPGEKSLLFEKDASVPAFSPDGRWIAYMSPASGNTNVFVRSVGGQGKWQVSSELGGYPRWSGDGRELYYVAPGTPQRPLMAVAVANDASFRAGPPRILVADLSRYMTSTAPQLDWDAAPAGDRFVFIEVERAKDEGTRIDIALHWARHLATASPGSQGLAR
jgi:serine/threonine-protein kinase